MCPLNVDLLSVTFDQNTAEIRSVIVTHPSAAIKVATFYFSFGLHTYSLHSTFWLDHALKP